MLAKVIPKALAAFHNRFVAEANAEAGWDTETQLYTVVEHCHSNKHGSVEVDAELPACPAADCHDTMMGQENVSRGLAYSTGKYSNALMGPDSMSHGQISLECTSGLASSDRV